MNIGKQLLVPKAGSNQTVQARSSLSRPFLLFTHQTKTDFNQINSQTQAQDFISDASCFYPLIIKSYIELAGAGKRKNDRKSRA